MLTDCSQKGVKFTHRFKSSQNFLVSSFWREKTSKDFSRLLQKKCKSPFEKFTGAQLRANHLKSFEVLFLQKKTKKKSKIGSIVKKEILFGIKKSKQWPA